jgi:ABC-type transport system substrate-binding protein
MSYTPPQPYRRGSSFSLTERTIAAVAILLLLAGLVGFVVDRNQRKQEQPVIGGTYTEGVITDSPTKVERIIARLTNIGLTYRDTDGSIKPAIAERWDITNDNKTYTFHLRDGYSASGLLSTIQNSKTLWTGVTINAPDESTLQFVLPEPLSLFLPTTTTPLFPFGPYKVIKRDDREVILRSNTEFALGEPYIQKIIIKQFESRDQLVKAAKNGEINGTADFDETIPARFKEHMVSLPRYYVLFLNLTRPAFKKQEDRERVVQLKDGNEVKYTLLTAQSGISSDLADSFAREANGKKIVLEVQKKNTVALQREEIQKREFDLLLYGINYGVEPDYYPFWHSSQVSNNGFNITGVKDKELDTLLETARKEQDTTKRHELTKKIEDHLSNKSYQKIMHQEQTKFWMGNSIKGMEYGTMDEANDRFQLVWRWYIKSKKVK